MLKQSLLALVLGSISLAAVYLPTFVLVSILIKSGILGVVSKLQFELVAAPWIILISSVLALIYMALIAKRQKVPLGSFGLMGTAWRFLILGVAFGLVFGFGLRLIGHALPLGAAPEIAGMQRWQMVLFFWIGAPIQEEFIFRGLIQCVAERRCSMELRLGKFHIHVSVLISALLFAVVHIGTLSLGASMGTALFTVCGAFLLGILAGWLRSQSGSLAPSVIVHALFNIIVG